jgi:hypothetical protein
MASDAFLRRFDHLLRLLPDRQRHIRVAELQAIETRPYEVAEDFFRRCHSWVYQYGPLTQDGVLDIAKQVGASASPRAEASEVLGMVSLFPVKPFREDPRGFAEQLDASGLLDRWSLIALEDEETITNYVYSVNRVSASAMNKSWEPIMNDIFTICVAEPAGLDVVDHRATSRSFVDSAKREGRKIDTPDRVIWRDKTIVGLIEYKGTSEKNQGDSMADRIVREALTFESVRAFRDIRYVVFLSGAGFSASINHRFDRLARSDRVVICTTDDEARRIGHPKIVPITRLAEEAKGW